MTSTPTRRGRIRPRLLAALAVTGCVGLAACGPPPASGGGDAGRAAVGLLALKWQSIWIGILAFFLISQAMAGWKQAQELARLESEHAEATRAGEANRPPML